MRFQHEFLGTSNSFQLWICVEKKLTQVCVLKTKLKNELHFEVYRKALTVVYAFNFNIFC